MMWEEGYKKKISQQEKLLLSHRVAMILPILLTERHLIQPTQLEIRRQMSPQIPPTQTQPLVIQLEILRQQIRHQRITLLRRQGHQLLTLRPCQTQEWTLSIHQIA